MDFSDRGYIGPGGSSGNFLLPEHHYGGKQHGAYTSDRREIFIYIDGQVYQEDEDLPQITNPGLAEDGVSLDNDEYFVLGDNRNNSEDSRFAEVQNINEKYIKGKVWFCIYPADQIGFVKD